MHPEDNATMVAHSPSPAQAPANGRGLPAAGQGGKRTAGQEGSARGGTGRRGWSAGDPDAGGGTLVRAHAFIDWDDTLAENIGFFRQAIEAMVDLISRELGLEPHVVAETGNRLDLEIARTMGLTRQSFPTAWSACYRELCRRVGREPDPGVLRQVRAHADWAYEQPQRLLDGAEPLLRWCRQEGFEVVIWTAGDPEVQRAKVVRSGLARLVDAVYTVSRKTPATLREHLDGRPSHLTVVVGNSLSSDVQPALANGVWAVHVPADTWEYDHAPVNVAHPLYRQAGSLREVPVLLATLLPRRTA